MYPVSCSESLLLKNQIVSNTVLYAAATRSAIAKYAFNCALTKNNFHNTCSEYPEFLDITTPQRLPAVVIDVGE
jgi:hypothetical protein